MNYLASMLQNRKWLPNLMSATVFCVLVERKIQEAKARSQTNKSSQEQGNYITLLKTLVYAIFLNLTWQ